MSLHHRRTPTTVVRQRRNKPLDTTRLANLNLSNSSQVNESTAQILEIGFGSGENLIHNCLKHPSSGFIGVELYPHGVDQLARKAVESQLDNLLIKLEDARDFLESSKFFDGIFVLFPDPWPKARHHKRRIINAAFLESLHQHLKPQGFLWIASDHEDYQVHIAEALDECKLFQVKKIQAKPGVKLINEQGYERITTRYDEKNLAKNQAVDFLCNAR